MSCFAFIKIQELQKSDETKSILQEKYSSRPFKFGDIEKVQCHIQVALFFASYLARPLKFRGGKGRKGVFKCKEENNSRDVWLSPGIYSKMTCISQKSEDPIQFSKNLFSSMPSQWMHYTNSGLYRSESSCVRNLV